MTFYEWLEFYSPGAAQSFSTGEIAPLLAAWDVAIEEAAKVCDKASDLHSNGAEWMNACDYCADEIRAFTQKHIQK